MTSNAKSSARHVVPAIVATLGLGCLLLADELQVPHSFQAGQPARASEVNANFEAIAELVNGALDGENLSSVVTLGDAASPGALQIVRTDGAQKFSAATNELGGGYIETRQNSDAHRAVTISTLTTDGGAIQVHGPNGNAAVQLLGTGDILKTGSNGFVHPHPLDPRSQIEFMSLEGGERGAYFRGSARLVGGRAELCPPETWRLVAAEQGITVQVTPRGDCAGLFVEHASRERVVVRELGGGSSEVDFDYFVTAFRRGFEDHQVVRPNTMFLPQGERWTGPLDRGNAPALVENGILLPDGTVDRALVDAIRTELLEHEDAPLPAGSVER